MWVLTKKWKVIQFEVYSRSQLGNGDHTYWIPTNDSPEMSWVLFFRNMMKSERWIAHWLERDPNGGGSVFLQSEMLSPAQAPLQK